MIRRNYHSPFDRLDELIDQKMLTIKCAACKRKLWKYDKIGSGQVLRCHKSRITRQYDVTVEGDRVKCPCGQPVGIDKGSFIKMIDKGFIYTGTKRSG